MNGISALLCGFGIACVGSAGAADLLAAQPSIWSNKPDIAAFETTENSLLAGAQRSIDKILANKGAKTVENTVADYDEASRQLDDANAFAGLMEAVNPDVNYRDHATAMTRKVNAAQTALSLNRAVYDSLSAVPLEHADAATVYFVKRQLLEFRLSGVNKDEATRARLKALNDQLTEAQSAFDRNINDDQKSVVVQDLSEFDGLPKDYIDAHKPDKDGVIHVTTSYPDFVPVMTFAKSDALRRRLALAYSTRAYPKNHDVLVSMMRARYEIATLLGYASWADYNAADKMIGNAAHIREFIQELNAAQRPLADKEFQMVLAEKKKVDPQATTVSSHERSYFSEQVRRASFNFDSQSVRPYFPYQQVKQGILDTASNLFHVSFRRETGTPAWDPAVETWLVLDQGQVIGRIYLDMHPRPGKYSHAEQLGLREGVRGKHLPEGVLICNFPAPNGSDPGLMEYDDVQTFFHEFGHLMHSILGGQQPWAGISGISMESDFVEAPSQMLEELLRSPQVLAGFAKHYQTGAVIPTDLVQRMNHASAFGRAGFVGAQLAYTATSYDIYAAKPENVVLDGIVEKNLSKYTPITPLPGTQSYAAFTHLSGYSSRYYTYMYDKVIALDFFEQFDPKNRLAGDAPMRYRRAVLEPGGSVSANDLVKNFLGRPQSMEALKRWMGAEFDPAAH